jgi:Zn-finger nucleic acid-binding protein
MLYCPNCEKVVLEEKEIITEEHYRIEQSKCPNCKNILIYKRLLTKKYLTKS